LVISSFSVSMDTMITRFSLFMMHPVIGYTEINHAFSEKIATPCAAYPCSAAKPFRSPARLIAGPDLRF
jgi:hypothetical protein